MIQEIVVVLILWSHPSIPPKTGGTNKIVIEREGTKGNSYMDTTGNLTGGIGHKMSPQEKLMYPEGTKIPKEVTDKWYETDIRTAKQSADSQLKDLGIQDNNFKNVLESVNYQLGSYWNKDHNKTWTALKNKDYDTAIQEINSSLWAKQTPTRAKDFIGAIEKLKQKGK